MSAQTATALGAPSRQSWAWIGVTPFLIFAAMFLIGPTLYLMVGAFQNAEGHWTFENIEGLFTPSILASYWISLKISFFSAALGALFGLALALAASRDGLPDWVRPTLMTFSGVASNFAGVPLAFAFLATLGRLGLVTILVERWFDFDIYEETDFDILSFAGLTLTYLYFQIPLMVLIVTPAIDGLRREWREASDILGGNLWHYWRYVALPILWPSILGSALLLFANAFGAVATAYALTGSSLNIVTLTLYAQIRGDVLHNQNLGYALALGMILITAVSNGGYIWLRARAERGRK